MRPNLSDSVIEAGGSKIGRLTALDGEFGMVEYRNGAWTNHVWRPLADLRRTEPAGDASSPQGWRGRAHAA